MKFSMSRTHVVRPADYESIKIVGHVEVDLDSKIDAEFADMTDEEIGDSLSKTLDEVLASEVDRALRSGGEHIEDTHLWAFYDRED
jgi:hypothetical protein